MEIASLVGRPEDEIRPKTQAEHQEMASFGRRLAKAIAVAAIASVTQVAAADPIVYTETGLASGLIGGTSFTNALVTITLTGDTSNIGPATLPLCASCLMNPGNSTVSIAGIGLATVTDKTAVLSTVTATSFGADYPLLPYVVIGVFDLFPALDDIIGMGFQGNGALLGFDLKSSIGPIAGSPGGIGYDPCCVIHTSRGNLSFASNFASTGVGTFTATLAPVPEPETYVLMMAGLGVVGLMARRRRAVAA
jgi:hypothetical protein